MLQVECFPILRRLPTASYLSGISSEDNFDTEEITDELLSSMSSMSAANSIRSYRQTNELVFQDDPDLGDVIREVLQDLSKHEKLVTTERINTRTKELIEVYDPETGESESYMTNSRSLSRSTSNSYVPYAYADDPYDADEEDVKVVSRTSYHWNILEKTLRKMALDETKVQIAYNIIREKQVNFHPSSSVYKILEKSVSILHTRPTRRYLGRPSVPPSPRLRRPVLLRGGRRNGQRYNRRNDRRHFADKLSRMNRYLKNKLAKASRKIVQKPLQFLYNSFG